MVLLFLVIWIILSTTNCTTINSAWIDDFTGWTVTDEEGTIVDNPVYVNSYTYKYHGPFSGDSNDGNKEYFSMTQSFYCAELSSVNVYYYIFFCGTEESDTVVLSLNDQKIASTTLKIPGTATAYTEPTLDKCDSNGPGYYKYHLGPLNIRQVDVNEAFNVQFDITVNYNNDYVMFREIYIECLPLTYSPTPVPTTHAPTTQTLSPTNRPTMATNPPSNNPTDAPTHDPTNYPTIFPSTPPTNKPTNSPTNYPSNTPSTSPTNFPSNNPSKSPTHFPTIEPTNYPTKFPSTHYPTTTTNPPSISPSDSPLMQPTGDPSATPTTQQPSVTTTQMDTQIPKNSNTGGSDSSAEIIVIISIFAVLCCVALVVGVYYAKYRNSKLKKHTTDDKVFGSDHYVQLMDNEPQRIFGTAVKLSPTGNTTPGGPVFNGNTNGTMNGTMNGSNGRFMADKEVDTDDMEENESDNDVIHDMLTPRDPIDDGSDTLNSDDDVINDMITPQ